MRLPAQTLLASALNEAAFVLPQVSAHAESVMTHMRENITEPPPPAMSKYLYTARAQIEYVDPSTIEGAAVEEATQDGANNVEEKEVVEKKAEEEDDDDEIDGAAGDEEEDDDANEDENTKETTENEQKDETKETKESPRQFYGNLTMFLFFFKIK